MIVYLLVHRHHLSLDPGSTVPDFMEDGEPVFRDDSEVGFKVLGLHSTRLRAEERIGRARTLPGFAEAPDGFSVHEYALDDVRRPSGLSGPPGARGRDHRPSGGVDGLPG
ncbi:hypothetical protein [Streptomyces sp. SID2119]|uniref:hypothetical protein n=1 Tax=Streptomyces sp. SID2119 TaxID=2690253 RepID=UPI00136E5619|nr:hypothetical protein [Streptomyces sp. SID2119]MYW32518.1 hypothetical protein [Streptomyces sp. SID2119]